MRHELSFSAPDSFSFEIDFQKGVGPASRVFSATHNFIKACEAIDSELVKSIDSNLETVLVLEDIQTGSIKTFLKSQLELVEDDSLRKLEWKPIVGSYLVKAKYAILEWCDSANKSRSLQDLRRDIQKIAAETNVRHLPDYVPPSPAALIGAVKDFQAAKEPLLPGDKATYVTAEGTFSLNLDSHLSVDEIEAFAVARSIAQPESEMILPVKKPDYLGNSKWELRHGRRNIMAKVEDDDWLRLFQNRKVDVRPGDALRCVVSVEHLYGYDYELIGERFTVVNVLEVLVDREQIQPLPL